MERDFDAIGVRTSVEDGILKIKAKSFIGENCFYYEAIPQHFNLGTVDTHFSVISLTGQFCSYSLDDGFSFGGNATPEFQWFCQNLVNYFKLYRFLISKDFSDHHNHANTEIVLYNSAKGIFKIRYETVPTIPDNPEYTSAIKSLLEYAKPIGLMSFFKNTLYSVSGGNDFICLNDAIAKAQEIVSITRRDYALVSKQFDFDKFRDSLYKEKDKYFQGIRDIVNKIFAQAIGVPISISAALFASYKVSDSVFLVLLVLGSFTLYIVFYVNVQWSYRNDLKEFEADFLANFKIIESKSGLPEDVVEIERLKVKDKIDSSLGMVQRLIEFVIALGLLFYCYIFHLLYLKFQAHYG
ncbi:MAG: hypothetical protein JSS76_19005 [Bacteroidetes bacterium]|nr:hypothetical protein [Bacteroidota bacterium]